MNNTSTRQPADPVALGMGAGALLLALLMVVQLILNHDLQSQIADNQKQVAKHRALANVDNSLVQLLAKSAYENHDAAITDLLARNGVTFRDKNQSGAATPTPTAAGAQ